MVMYFGQDRKNDRFYLDKEIGQDDGQSTVEITRVEKVPREVKLSEFGCRNCLWNCCECRDGSMYKPEGTPVKCKAYTYYD
ncbi:hypothetical protein LCGC14_1149270 [marine sediment metagenome]|uniref:Uncharacterized protein n=1 Tax=marine sediment metagenome TaxID=412755 RepID=A0A0F9MJA2_9ZZZZ